MTVIKRDGREVEFDKTKISDAICRGPLVLQTLYASVQGKARAKKWE